MTSNDVILTSTRRHDVASTFIRRCLKVVCLLGYDTNHIEQIILVDVKLQKNWAKTHGPNATQKQQQSQLRFIDPVHEIWIV